MRSLPSPPPEGPSWVPLLSLLPVSLPCLRKMAQPPRGLERKSGGLGAPHQHAVWTTTASSLLRSQSLSVWPASSCLSTATQQPGGQDLPTGETSWSHWAARDASKYFHVFDRWRERSVRALASTQSLSATAPSSTLAVRPPTTRHHETGPRAGTRDRKTQNYSPSKASSLAAIRHPRQ